MTEKNISIAKLSKTSGVGYNYVFKIVRNRVDFNRCGIGTAKKIASALDMSLDAVYEYKENYYNSKIYYQDQTNWGYEDYGELNAELNKLLLNGIDYRFAKKSLSRETKVYKYYDMEISCIQIEKLSEETKCIMVAILNQQKKLSEFVDVYSNLKPLITQKPLKNKLIISKTPYNIFQSYISMNIEY